MRKVGKGIFVMVAALLIFILPAQAVESSKNLCKTTVGKNVVSYDCDYVAHGYQTGSPLSLQMDYSCSGRCGGVLAFGLDNPGYEPRGEVRGRIVSLDRRSPGSMGFTMKFDELAQSASSRGQSEGTAFMTFLVNVDDGSGKYRATPLPFKVRVNSHPGGNSGSH